MQVSNIVYKNITGVSALEETTRVFPVVKFGWEMLILPAKKTKVSRPLMRALNCVDSLESKGDGGDDVQIFEIVIQIFDFLQ
jgi:hypothetical protein